MPYNKWDTSLTRNIYINLCRTQWQRGLRRDSAAARLLVIVGSNPAGSYMSLSCECCALSGRGLCDAPITRSEESYRMWCVWVRSWSLDNDKDLGHKGLMSHGIHIYNMCTRVGLCDLYALICRICFHLLGALLQRFIVLVLLAFRKKYQRIYTTL